MTMEQGLASSGFSVKPSIIQKLMGKTVVIGMVDTQWLIQS